MIKKLSVAVGCSVLRLGARTMLTDKLTLQRVNHGDIALKMALDWRRYFRFVFLELLQKSAIVQVFLRWHKSHL